MTERVLPFPPPKKKPAGGLKIKITVDRPYPPKPS